MNRTERIVRNVLSNWTGFAVNAIVMLLLTPYVLSSLGVESYGIWIIINSVIGYYGMLDLGFRAGVNQFLIRSIAADDYREASVVFSSAFYALGVLALLIAIITVASAFVIPELLDMSKVSVEAARNCILIVGLAASFQILLSPFASAIIAIQRFDILNAIAISTRVLFALLTVYLIKLDMQLVGLAIASAVTTVLGCVLQYLVASRRLPELKISRRLAKLRQLRDIGSFGLWNFLISMVAYAYLHLLPIIIAAYMPIAAVGHYALAAGIWHQLSRMFTPIGQVLYPVAAEMHVRDESQSLARLYEDGSRLLMMIVIPVTLIAAIWADDFFRLWVGEEFVAGSQFVSVATLLQILLVSTVIGYASNIAGQILIGAGFVRSFAIAQTVGALVAIIITVAFIGRFGLLAVVVGPVFGTILSDIFLVQIAVRRRLKLSPWRLFRRSAARLLAVFGCCFLIYSTIQNELASETWMELASQGVVAGTIGVAIIAYVGMTNDERRRIVYDPLSKLRGLWTARR